MRNPTHNGEAPPNHRLEGNTVGSRACCIHLLATTPCQHQDPLIGLAVWFMDDGGRGGNTRHGLVIDVSSFKREDHCLLQAAAVRMSSSLGSTCRHRYRATALPWREGQQRRSTQREQVVLISVPSMRWKLYAYDQDKSFVNTGSGAASIDPVTTEER
jgi:hypothetical protein